MSPSQEKVGEEVAFENIEAAGSDLATKNAPISPDDFGFSPEEQKKIIRQVDRRLVLTIGAMYCVSAVDRANLAAVNIAGMSKDLLLIEYRYVSSVLPLERDATC
jgi:hypothetical protein